MKFKKKNTIESEQLIEEGREKKNMKNGERQRKKSNQKSTLYSRMNDETVLLNFAQS